MSSKNNNEIMVPPSKKAFEQTFLSEKYNVPTSLFLNLLSAKLIAVKGYHYLMATFSCTFHSSLTTDRISDGKDSEFFLWRVAIILVSMCCHVGLIE